MRALRQRLGLSQTELAVKLGISVSYLSQIENDDRPLTAAVRMAIGRHFPHALPDIEAGVDSRLFAAFASALDDPAFAGEPMPPELVERVASQQSQIAERFVALHIAWRQAEERLQMVNETLEMGAAEGGGRLPWEEVRDWFHAAGNYVDTLDQKAEILSNIVGGGQPPDEAQMRSHLAEVHGIVTATAPEAGGEAVLRALDRITGTLTLASGQQPESRRFQVAHQLAAIEMAGDIAAIVERSGLASEDALRLLKVGLANYAAGALLMPYERFRAAAQELRHDIDRLSRRFAVSFEQACHRLSTLQRPGARGVPVFFCRVDMAGNITKRHSATRLEFARFGGACPLWIVHEAVAIPDRILVQLAETPDGARYVSIAKGLVKPSGRYDRAPRRYAVALGCEIVHADQFIYADGLDLKGGTATPIGSSCRICPRTDCDQRAFPPATRAIHIDPDRREVVPYQVG